MSTIDFEKEVESFQDKSVKILNICNDEKNMWLYHHFIEDHHDSHLYIYSDKKEDNEFKKKNITWNNIKKLQFLLNSKISFSKNRIDSFFDIILIQFYCLSDPVSNLITIFQLLKDNGKILIIDYTKKEYEQIKSFTQIYINYIKVSELNHMISIHKIINDKQENIYVPNYIQYILDHLNNTLLFHIKEKVKHEKIKNIYWDFEFDNSYYQGYDHYGYNYEVQKYFKYIYGQNLFKIYTMEHFLMTPFKNTSTNIYLSKKFNIYVRDIWRQITDQPKMQKIFVRKKHTQLFSDSLSILNKSSIFILTDLKNKTEIPKHLSFKNVINPIYSKNKSKNSFQTSNLYDFHSIHSYIQQYNKLYKIIYVNLNKYIKNLKSIHSFIQYQDYLLVHMLYMILSIQQKGGELYFITTPLVNHVQIQFLQILSSFYKKVSLKIYQTYQHQYFNVVIHATDFIGISKEDLKDFETKYQTFYDAHVASHIQKMFEGKRIKDLHLKSIFSNPISKNLQKSVYDFNTEYYKLFIPGVQSKLDLHEFLSSKSTSKKQKEFVKNEIFKMQYQHFIKTYKEVQKNMKNKNLVK